VDCRLEDGGLAVDVSHEAGDSARLTAVLEREDERTSAEMEETSPGLWRCRFDTGSPGIASVSVLKNGKERVASRVISIPYARELAATGTDEAALAQIASLTGGRLLRMGELPEPKPGTTGSRSLRPILAALAAACLVADVAAAWARSRRKWVTQESADGDR
jgi:hypothetical protein